MKIEETTTPYPIDEEATECGENCSFEDGKDQGGRRIASGMDLSELSWSVTGLGYPGSEIQRVLGRYNY